MKKCSYYFFKPKIILWPWRWNITVHLIENFPFQFQLCYIMCLNSNQIFKTIWFVLIDWKCFPRSNLFSTKAFLFSCLLKCLLQNEMYTKAVLFVRISNVWPEYLVLSFLFQKKTALLSYHKIKVHLVPAHIGDYYKINVILWLANISHLPYFPWKFEKDRECFVVCGNGHF